MSYSQTLRIKQATVWQYLVQKVLKHGKCLLDAVSFCSDKMSQVSIQRFWNSESTELFKILGFFFFFLVVVYNLGQTI